MVNLIIVHDKKTSEIAQQLNAMISTIPNCQSRVMDEEHWKDNRFIVSSEQHVLYMGNIPDGNAIRPIMVWKYDYKNMKYGWIGTKGILSVDASNFKSEDAAEIKRLLEDQNTKIKDKKNLSLSIAKYAAVQVAFGLIGVGITAVTSYLINNHKDVKELITAEYEYLLTRFVTENDLIEFLGLIEDGQEFEQQL